MSEQAADPAQAVADLINGLPEARRRRLRRLFAQTEVPAGRVGMELQIGRIDDFGLTKNAILSLTDICWPDSIRYGFVEIRDAIVTPFGFVIAGNQLIFNTQILPGGWMRGADGGAPELIERIFGHNFIHRLDIWNESCLLSVPVDLPEIAEPAFLFNSRLTCFNFAHFVHDTLIQAPTFRDCCEYLRQEATPILVGPGFPHPVMPEIFRRAAGSAAPFFLRNRFFRVRRLFVPTTHFRPSNDAIARGAVVRLAQTLSASLQEFHAPTKRRLFISREDSGRGEDREPRFANAQALQDALSKLGVEPVVVSRLGVEEYLRSFVNAELIVGLHGAGLTNVLLSDQPRVVEITVPGYPDWRSLALFIETGMGAPFRRVRMAAPAGGVAEYDVARIVEACEALLTAPCPPVAPPL